MDDHSISLVRESFDLIEPIAPQAGAMFYANLFEADPSLQRLFAGDTDQHAAQLMQMLTLAVSQLDQPEVLSPKLDEIGRRLGLDGVRDEDYDTAGAALLKTLYQGLGVAYNEEVEEAWVKVYGTVAERMKAAARLPTETTSA